VPSLIDRATGKVVQVADEQAAEAVTSGKFGFQAGTRVPVVQQDGTIGTVASKDAAKALAQGLTLATTDQFKGAQYAAKYEGSPLAAAFQTAASTGQGMLRSLSLGTSDAAQIGLAQALGDGTDANFVREGLRDQKAAHPWAEAAGEVGGFLLPAALTGGASAAGAVPRGIMSAGRATEAGVARMLGGGTAARIAGAATGAGTEAALMGVGHDISDAALENKPLTAEAMLAHGALNFATGAAIGGALKGGGEGLARVLSRGGDAAAPGVSAKLADIADKHAFDSLGADLTAVRKAGDRAAQIGKDFRELIPEYLGKRIGTASREELAEAAEKGVETIGKKVGAAVKSVDESIAASPMTGEIAANAPGPSMRNVVEKARTEILHPLEEMPGFEGVHSKVASYLDSLEAKAGDGPMTFAKYHEMRQGLDKLIYRNVKTATPAEHIMELRAVRGLMEDEMTAAMQSVDPTARAAYDAAKGQYASMKFASDALTKKVAREEFANRAVSLTDTISAGAGLASGGIFGGAAAGLANNIVRTRGSMIAADAFGTLAKLTSAERATTRVTSEITNSVKGFFSSVPHASELGAQVVTQANVAKYMDSVANLNANPAAQAEKFAQSMGDLPKTAPELTQELAATNTRGLAFLASKLPPNRSGDGSLQPLAEKSALTTEQKRKWALYANTVNDPRSALRDLKSGRFTPEQAEALRVVYPQLYAVVQKAAMEQLAAQKEKLPLAKSAALGTILGVPGAAALTPQRLQANQAVYQQPKQGRAPRAAKAPSIASAFKTTSQRLESR